MRYFCSAAIAFAFLVSSSNSWAQLSPLQDDKACISPQITPRSLHHPNAFHERSNTVVLFEDFENTTVPQLPAGWNPGEPVEQQTSNGEGLGTFVSAWRTGDAPSANNGGYLPVPDISGNHFAYANDDGPPCNCDMEDVGLITPELDFTGLQNMMVSFDVYSQAVFGGDNLRLEISTDGTTFETIFNATSSPEWQTTVHNLSAFDNEPSVWLRFAWSDNGNWSAGVAIDNVLIAENYDYDAGILRAHVARVDAAWNDTEVISGEYSQTPLSQATNMVLGARIMNKGALPLENLVLSVTIHLEGNTLGSFNSLVVPILYPMQQQDLFVTTDIIPDEAETYTITYELLAPGDENPNDNVATRQKKYSMDVYAMDNGQADSFRDNNSQSFTIGNLYEIPNEGTTCYSIGVGIGAPTVPLTQIQVRLYNSNFLFVAGSSNYVIQSSDLIGLGEGEFVNIPLNEPVVLESGQDYIAAVTYFHNPMWQFAVANSGSSQEQFSVFQDMFGDWFFVTTTPMVRMNLSPTVSTQELTKAENLKLFPNPVRDQYTLELGRSFSGNAQLTVHTIHGKVVADEQFSLSGQNQLHTPISLVQLPPGMYLMTLTQDDFRESIRIVKSE